MGPTLKKTNKKHTNKEADGRLSRQREWEGEDFFFILFSSFFSQIYRNRTVGIRRTKNDSALRDEGYA